MLHISSRALSPGFPHPLLERFGRYLPSTSTESTAPGEFSTRFHLVLEPLVLSVLPMTAVPALALIVIFGVVAGLTVPTIIRLLERAAFSTHGKVD